MACFTSLPYKDKSYPFLQTIWSKISPPESPISFGCFSSSSDAARMFAFYLGFAKIAGLTPVSENCFVQKNEDQQYYLLNEALDQAFTPR